MGYNFTSRIVEMNMLNFFFDKTHFNLVSFTIEGIFIVVFL